MELPRYGPLKKATGAGEQCRGQGSKPANGTEIILGIA